MRAFICVDKFEECDTVKDTRIAWYLSSVIRVVDDCSSVLDCWAIIDEM